MGVRTAVEQSPDWSAKERINPTELRQIHRLVVEPAWLHSPPEGLDRREGPGAFRQHDIRPFTGGMTPPLFPEVPALVTDWLGDASRGPTDGQHPMLFVADIHACFERIHPFRDGNGRVGRLTTNLLLVRHGYPPAVIYKRDRSRYLNALRSADRGDAGPLAEIFARAVTDGIYRFLLPGLAGPHRLVPLRSLADSELSGNALSVAAKRPPACRSPDGSVVLDEAVGPGLQGQPLQACVNSTDLGLAKVEQVNLRYSSSGAIR